MPYMEHPGISHDTGGQGKPAMSGLSVDVQCNLDILYKD